MLALIKTFPFVRAFIRSLFYFLIWCRLLGICCFLSWDSCICRKLKRMSVCDFYSFVKFYWKELVLKAVRPRSEKLSHRHLNMAINLIFIGNQTRKITNNFFFYIILIHYEILWPKYILTAEGESLELFVLTENISMLISNLNEIPNF